MENYKKLLSKILIKKAKGYTVREKTEEFSASDGELTLQKRKVVTKHVPPDVNAVKALLQLQEEQADLSRMTDEQLAVEKLRLVRLLAICDDAVDGAVEE